MLTNLKIFLHQQVFPGLSATKANRQISTIYKNQINFEVELSNLDNKEDDLIEQLKSELTDQLDKKSKIEDKAKSLLFTITLSITIITFTLNYLSAAEKSSSILLLSIVLTLSILYFVLGAIRSLQILNVKLFHIYQTNITIDDNKFIIKTNSNKLDLIKDLTKSRELNNLILLKQTNLTFASFNLIRNGIILFAIFFILTIFTFLNSSLKRSQNKNSDNCIPEKISTANKWVSSIN